MNLDTTHSPKTEIGKYLELQPFYNIIVTDRVDSIKIMFVDFKYNKDTSGLGVVSSDIFTNEIHLKKEFVEIKDDNIHESLSNFLNEEFLKIVERLADKNRNSKDSPMNGEFDMDYAKIIEELPIQDPNLLTRKVVAKINNLSNWIATTCRIGPGQFIITNSITNEFLLKTYNNSQLYRLFVSNSLESGKIIMGRKNSFDQQGILLVLNENSLNDIGYKNGKSYVNLIYAFSINGFYPEKNYYSMYIKNKF
jgi:hypothetical protein